MEGRGGAGRVGARRGGRRTCWRGLQDELEECLRQLQARNADLKGQVSGGAGRGGAGLGGAGGAGREKDGLARRVRELKECLRRLQARNADLEGQVGGGAGWGGAPRGGAGLGGAGRAVRGGAGREKDGGLARRVRELEECLRQLQARNADLEGQVGGWTGRDGAGQGGAMWGGAGRGGAGLGGTKQPGRRTRWRGVSAAAKNIGNKNKVQITKK